MPLPAMPLVVDRSAFENVYFPETGVVLGRDSALPAAIRAVIDGMLVPVGHTAGFLESPVTYSCPKNLRRYRPVPDVETIPESFLNFREAASMWGSEAMLFRAW